MAGYEFLTLWRVNAPQEKVWELIFNAEDWPAWWRGVERVEKLRNGDANHVGALHRYTWKSKLPYRLIFEMETTRVEPPSLIEGRAIGELQGAGRWQLSTDGEITTIRYDWQVETTKAWMNYLAPIAGHFLVGTTMS
jgi:carbon monoxide dehydrogenase subunit G